MRVQLRFDLFVKRLCHAVEVVEELIFEGLSGRVALRRIEAEEILDQSDCVGITPL